MGQNFLTNTEISKKTAGISLGGYEGQSCGAIEIGPGAGALTSELCALYKKVVAIEIDRGFEAVLGETLGEFDNLKIIFGDILKTDLDELIKNEFQGCAKVNICGNLPYYITTPIVMKLVKSEAKPDNITAMVQREAADKLCSDPGSERYNATAAAVCYYGTAKKMFDVAKSNFYPCPKVLSSVVNITPHKKAAALPKDEALMYKVIEAAFGKRRKTLANALSSDLGLDKGKVSEIVAAVTGNKDIRGEQLDIKAFSDISDLIFDLDKI